MCILQCLGYCPKSYVRVLTQSNTLTIAREKAAKALKEKGETPEELLRSIKENEAAVAEAQRVVDAWKAIVGEKSRREEASKAEAERIAAEERERAEAEEEARVEAERKAEEERKTKEEERKERDENGQPFVVSSDGTTTFGEITEDTGLTAAPIKLSEGVADEMGNGYGLRHIEARHGDQIRKAGFSSVEEFIEQVAKNYDVIKEGSDRNGNKTYRLLLTDKHNNTLMIELSKDGSYWNVNTAGVFKKSYGKDKKEVYNRHTTVKQSAETAETSQADEHSGTQSTSRMNVPTTSADKGSEKPEKKQEKQSVFDKAKEIADKEEKKRKAEADKPKQKPLTEAERKDAKEVAGALGYRVEWVDTMEENGTIDADKKVIRIAKDAENPLVQVLGHEVAHGVKRMDGGKFKALQKAAMEVVGEKEWNERIEKKHKLNAYAEGKLAEEVTCDIVGEALNDKDALKRLAESLRGERGILARLRDAVVRMVEYFKSRGDKEGVRRMKAADKLLAEFESALKEGANERRLSPDTPIRLVNADADHGFKNYEEARAWAKENIARTYGNDETGGKGEIRISNTAIGKFLSEKAVGKSESKDVHLAVLRVLPDVIRESVDAEQHADYRKGADGKRGGNGVNPDVTMHILYGAVTIDGKTYRVKTTLKENVRDNEPTKAYTYEATKIELLAGPNEKATVSTFSRDSNNSITAAKLLKDVKKSYSNEEFFADENVERSVMEKGELTDAEVAEKERDIDHSVRSSKEMAEERLEIERKAKSDGTWLKAPNGKRTNLNERQWVDVRTKNFKEWFGDWENDPENASKIVDENGEPLMVFHYTPEDFTVFGEGKEIGASTFYNASDANYAATAAVGDWFTSKSDLPDYMGKPMRVFLNIKEPSDGRSLEVLADEVGYEISSKDYEAFDEDRDNTAPIIEAGKNYQEKLRDRGYDGIFIADEEFGGTSYITFAPNQIKSAVENDGSYSPKENDIRRSVREKKEDENTELTAEERELRDNLVERMRKGGLDVVTDSEEMQRVIDTENERTRNKRSKKSEAARKRDEALYAVDWSTAFVSGKSREEAAEIRRERGRKFKEETKELYGRVLSGNFDDVTLRLIDKFVDNSTPNNPYERPISKRLPARALQKMRGRERTGSIDALFSRISESAVGKDGKALPRAERERAIEEKKKELLKKWAIATGNWHTDIADFTDQREPIGSGTDSDVYLGKDGKSVIKVSKGKPYGKRFRPDVDNVALFNTVFPGSRYTIEGYGEIDGKFVRFLKQPIVDFTSSTPLTEGERVAYMEKLGFKPINKENTAFSNGEIIASDLQKSNIVKDKQGNVRVIDADMKLHTKDFGGKFSYPDAETDTRTAGGEVYTGSVREHRVYHGSGADFDAFDHSHMGEGEGAQAYGWGTYVTEVEGIGKTYAEQNATTHNDALRAL